MSWKNQSFTRTYSFRVSAHIQHFYLKCVFSLFASAHIQHFYLKNVVFYCLLQHTYKISTINLFNTFMLTLEFQRFPVLGEVSFFVRTLPNRLRNRARSYYIIVLFYFVNKNSLQKRQVKISPKKQPKKIFHQLGKGRSSGHEKPRPILLSFFFFGS